MTDQIRDLETDLAELESAEDFLDYFGIAYERAIVQVNRLHILQRFHNYVAARRDTATPRFDDYRVALALAYDDFVHSDALTEKVFSVLKRASGIATVPVNAIGRVKH